MPLVNPIFNSFTHLEEQFPYLKNAKPQKLADGVYIAPDHNPEMWLLHEQGRPYDHAYPNVGPDMGFPNFKPKGGNYRASYGVCDGWEQLIEKSPDLKTCTENVVVFLCEINKADEPPRGGWRWHKWGPYIGTHEIQFEYLAEEEGIERVFTYRIIHLLDDEFEK